MGGFQDRSVGPGRLLAKSELNALTCPGLVAPNVGIMQRALRQYAKERQAQFNTLHRTLQRSRKFLLGHTWHRC